MAISNITVKIEGVEELEALVVRLEAVVEAISPIPALPRKLCEADSVAQSLNASVNRSARSGA